MDKLERITLPKLCKLSLSMWNCKSKYRKFYSCNRKISFTVFCSLFICQTLKTFSCYYTLIAQLKRKLILLWHFLLSEIKSLCSISELQAFASIYLRFKIIIVCVPSGHPAHTAIDFSLVFLVISWNYCMLGVYMKRYLVFPT